MQPTEVPSVNAVNKSGDALRALIGRGAALTEDELNRAVQAVDVLVAWRAAHATPLATATMGLRSRVQTAGCADGSRVSQRLKRIPTILDKLHRQPKMELGRMHDIGGCRVVLGELAQVYEVLDRYRARPTAGGIKVQDYIAEPKDDGYRGVHVIVKYHGRRIEVQLRTQVQHEWAFTVETVTSRYGLAIKSGGGPAPVREWFQTVSEAMAIEEHGGTVDDNLLHRVTILREAAQPYLRGSRR
ncbi:MULTISPECIES: RelA/SpoT domain-containing protein [unclassified Mycobacterium]